VSQRNLSISVGMNLFSPQCGGWKHVYYDSWRYVVMKEFCGVRYTANGCLLWRG